MPKDHKITRGTRRAASKEALKQMKSILVGDDKRYEISSDDDDIIAIDVIEPPKKKYKLHHRKSAENSSREVIVIKKVATVEDYFDIEAVAEDLEPCQKIHLEGLQMEESLINEKIELLENAPNVEVIHRGTYVQALEISENVEEALIAAQSSPTKAQKNVILQQSPAAGNNAIPQSYQLVMDPRLGVIVGAVSNSSTKSNSQQIMYKTANTASTTPEQPMKTRRGTTLRQVSPQMTPSPTGKGLQVRSMLQKIPLTTPSPKPIIAKAKAISGNMPTYRPTESTVEGGLNMGAKSGTNKTVDQPEDRSLPDSREVSFNKLQGRTYPSLVVVARPHLRVKDLASDRGKLDIKVKSVLMYPPTKFTEWLIQQGLVRSDQKCSNHPDNPLKLGMYSDATKFQYSGGYVWISECCPQKFVSVFNGSLFEGSQHPPMAILKILYHWSCQTIVQNVTQWVKVDNLYVKGMYTWLRALCTVGLHTHVKQLGGPGVKVQIGVISLGTTSQDGNKREVKVEVLGILETTTKHIRLRAVEPLPDGDRSYKKRFRGILEPVYKWVHPASHIVTDLTVDKQTLHQMGFVNVVQSTSSDPAQSNRTIMQYLRSIVPRMFQNTLSLLSRQIIQQFLDELVWREWYGTTVLQCFDNMLLHISEQTRYDGGGNKEEKTLVQRLNKVVANPFKNWAIPLSPPVSTTLTNAEDSNKRYGRQRKAIQSEPITATPISVTPSSILSKTTIASTTITPTSELARVAKSETPRPGKPTSDISRPSKSTSPDVPEQMVPLENYYYGTVTPAQSLGKNKITAPMKCSLCKMSFSTNITLMNHLYKHAHNVSNDVQLCRYCLTIVPTGPDLLKHIDTSHPAETKFDNGFVCLICEAHFRNPFILGKHMSKEHCPSELPYSCGTCGFRCSNHKQSVDHFYQQHDNGSTIQCPFCLKSTTIYSSGRNISQNMNYFIQHLQKHQKKNLAKRCGRCTLWFIQKEFLKDHQVKLHASQRGKSGLVPCFAPRNGVMVPKSKMDKCPDDSKLINFSTLYFNVSKNLNCKECNQPMGAPKHFVSFERCQNQNCQFSTSCATSMQEHNAKCKSMHETITNVKLPYEMFCICGYSDTCGNALAKHLAICERKSSYPSMEAAKEATVTHSMLDVLGLVRKPDETASKEPPLILTRSEPLVLKRARGRKSLQSQTETQADNEVFEIERKDSFELINLSISEVKGGVDIDLDLNESENKEKSPQVMVNQSIDLTEFEDEDVVMHESTENEGSNDTRESQIREKQNVEKGNDEAISQDDHSQDVLDQNSVRDTENNEDEVQPKRRKLNDTTEEMETMNSTEKAGTEELIESSETQELVESSRKDDAESLAVQISESDGIPKTLNLETTEILEVESKTIQEENAEPEEHIVKEKIDVNLDKLENENLEDTIQQTKTVGKESETKDNSDEISQVEEEKRNQQPGSVADLKDGLEAISDEILEDPIEGDDKVEQLTQETQEMDKSETENVEDEETENEEETEKVEKTERETEEVEEETKKVEEETEKSDENIEKLEDDIEKGEELIEKVDGEAEKVEDEKDEKEKHVGQDENEYTYAPKIVDGEEKDEQQNKIVQDEIIDEIITTENDNHEAIETEEGLSEKDLHSEEEEKQQAQELETALNEQTSENILHKNEEINISNQIDALLSESDSKSSTHSDCLLQRSQDELVAKDIDQIIGERYNRAEDVENATSQRNSNTEEDNTEALESGDTRTSCTSTEKESFERVTDEPMMVDDDDDNHINSDQLSCERSLDEIVEKSILNDAHSTANAIFNSGEHTSFDYNDTKNNEGDFIANDGLLYENTKSNVAADSVTKLNLLENMNEAPVDSNCSNAASLAIENNMDTENLEGVFCPMDTTSFT